MEFMGPLKYPLRSRKPASLSFLSFPFIARTLTRSPRIYTWIASRQTIPRNSIIIPPTFLLLLIHHSCNCTLVVSLSKGIFESKEKETRQLDETSFDRVKEEANMIGSALLDSRLVCRYKQSVRAVLAAQLFLASGLYPGCQLVTGFLS